MFVYESHKWRPTSDVIVVISLILCCVCSVGAIGICGEELWGCLGRSKINIWTSHTGNLWMEKSERFSQILTIHWWKSMGFVAMWLMDSMDLISTRMACGSSNDRSVRTEKYFQNPEDDLIMCRIMSLLKIHRSQMSPINYHRHTFATSARARSVEMFPTVFLVSQ